MIFAGSRGGVGWGDNSTLGSSRAGSSRGSSLERRQQEAVTGEMEERNRELMEENNLLKLKVITLIRKGGDIAAIMT